MKITFKGKDYVLKYGYRPLMIYENIAKKSFNPSGLTDIIYFFYSCVLAQAIRVGDNIKYEEFMDYLDEQPNLVEDFSSWLIETLQTQKDISPVTEKKEDVEVNEKN